MRGFAQFPERKTHWGGRKVMRYAVPLVFAASPALAHHEVVVASVLPGLAIYLVAGCAGGVAGLLGWYRKRK